MGAWGRGEVEVQGVPGVDRGETAIGRVREGGGGGGDEGARGGSSRSWRSRSRVEGVEFTQEVLRHDSDSETEMEQQERTEGASDVDSSSSSERKREREAAGESSSRRDCLISTAADHGIRGGVQAIPGMAKGLRLQIEFLGRAESRR